MALGAAIPRWLAGATFQPAWLAAGMAVPALVLARVVVETAIDATSHNLWPFEVMIAGAWGLSVAAAGALLGGLAERAFSARAPSERD